MRTRALLPVVTALLVAVPLAAAGTSRNAAAPVATTNDPTSITSTSVTLNGKTTLNCSGTRGFKLAYPDHTSTISNATGAGTSSFTANVTGLAPGTAYSYYAFGADCNDFVSGNPKTFTTKALVNVTITGGGKLTGGIACTSSCAVQVDSGVALSVTATANAGSKFSGWTGICAGQGATCTVTPTGTATLGVSFTAVHTLTVAKAGDGAGTVTAGSDINCGAACSASFASGTSVALAATPAAGSVFVGWSGGCSGSALTCTVSLANDQSVTATFGKQRRLSVGVHGGGLVTSIPEAISCATACFAFFAPNENVVLTAAADSGWRFVGWSAPCSGAAATCAVTMAADTTVTAEFRPLFTLRVLALGGKGTVRSAPNGILCGKVCSKAFLQGAVVTLRASAAKGYRFTGWAGDCKGAKASCTVTMRQARDVVAQYAKK